MRTPLRHLPRVTPGLLACCFAACSSPRPAPGAASSPPSNAAASVKARGAAHWVTLSRLTPGFAPEGGAAGTTTLTQIREGDYLFFKNPDGAPFVQVKIDGDFHESKECATYSGFECLGKSCQSRPIEPGGVVSLCFHHAGRFNIHILGPEPAVGVVEVVVR